ncbi:alpha/beta fold hydrolase [Neorhizobium alkalisoli]|uniref:alpha/beta fold hydrolase n=1 Tax=Neorhizobium alkalisoli TaxID=528178 RepID=UPI00315A6E71
MSPRNEASAAADHPVHHSQIEANGASFHVVEQGRGPVVLFLHGFPDTVETWRSQMQVVAENGYRAVALDMRGFGDSYSPDDPALIAEP